jgi:superfamily II DNA or RNA helicase/HKD family nuclease
MSVPCPFCDPRPEQVFHEGELIRGVWDAFPVSPGHALLVTRRHVSSWFDATDAERAELTAATLEAHFAIQNRYPADGYNIGANVDAAGGQTVPHLHLHVIPRRSGDVPNPRGGVRHVIPARGDYLVTRTEKLLSAGGDDPVLPHLRLDLATASSIDIAVAFVMPSGVARIYSDLADVISRGATLRLLTGDYLGLTDPDALMKLLDLAELHPNGKVDLRVYVCASTSFHPKSYVFRSSHGRGVAYVGSSNLSRSALETGVEWNYRVVTSRDQEGFTAVTRAFDALFSHPATVAVTHQWLQDYRQRRPVPGAVQNVQTNAAAVDALAETVEAPPVPTPVQLEALAALERTRASGNSAGLVVLATGLGKTWLSAFDSDRTEFRRVLFVAHREEILAQALQTFRRIRPQNRLGRYDGKEKLPDADVVFASIATLGKQPHLDQFRPDAFDYIVVDEFHHAAARTYRRLLRHFHPRFMLGLTATPERTDGGDLLQLCQENLVFRCDLIEGIRQDLLCPFQYFGVPDEVDYRNIPWRSTRFDEEALTTAVATRSRAQNAFDQWTRRRGKRTLAFCVSTRHATFMRDFFRAGGARVAAVHSDARTTDPRSTSLEALAAGELDVVFAVDMFNEGVDLPSIDTVMMLRPTESAVLWLQQLGRGLRKADGKQKLTVIDYIGNHRTFLLKPKTLLQLQDASDRELHAALLQLERGELDLPPGCEVTYELGAIDIIRGLLRLPSSRDALKAYYLDFRERHGTRPTATEAFHDGYAPRSARSQYGSWLGFVGEMGDLLPAQRRAFELAREFLEDLETTQVTKSYKLLVLIAMLNRDRLPGELSVVELVQAVREVAQRSATLQADLGEALAKKGQVRSLLLRNPIAAWVGALGTGGRRHFALDGEQLRFLATIPDNLRSDFQELVRELCDWRLAEYLQRPTVEQGAGGAFVAKVSHAGGRPILFLPPRDDRSHVPEGWVRVEAGGVHYNARFAKVAVNVVSRPDSDENELPAILRGWFGPDAGLPGTNYLVACEPVGDGYRIEPANGPRERKLEPWATYSREQIPSFFGTRFSEALWNVGFIPLETNLILLVTLEKGSMHGGFKYEDRFLSPERFQWQSQNRTSQSSKHGLAIRNHVARGINVHLFVRDQKRIGAAAAPFMYCGPVTFESWQGERPITVVWKLQQGVPPRHQQLLIKPR